MEGRHAFKIEIKFSVTFCLDFERCVAAVRKRVFDPVLTAIKRISCAAPIFLQRIFFAGLLWTAGKLKPVVIVVVVVMFHRFTIAINNHFGLGLSPEIMQSVSDVLTFYVLQNAGFLK